MAEIGRSRSFLVLAAVIILVVGVVLLKQVVGRSARSSAGSTSGKSGGPLSGADLDKCLKSGIPTVADFGVGSCVACKLMEPVLAQAAPKYRDRVNIVFVSTDQYPAAARRYQITAIPTQVLFDAEGKEVGRHIGYYPIEDLEAQLRSLGLAK